MELITQYMVDMYSHLAMNTTASYGQQINLLLDFLDAAPELSSELIFGVGEIDRVVLMNCTMTGMVIMLHQANSGLGFNLYFNGIRSMRPAVRKMWATRAKKLPTDHHEFEQFIEGITERMGNETGSKWAMPVEVMQALVAMATEDAGAARTECDFDQEREVRTKAMYHLVCYLIWPRPVRRANGDISAPNSQGLYVPRSSEATEYETPRERGPVQGYEEDEEQMCGRGDCVAHADHGSGRHDATADPDVRGNRRSGSRLAFHTAE
jgi:hypothetical protein